MCLKIVSIVQATAWLAETAIWMRLFSIINRKACNFKSKKNFFLRKYSVVLLQQVVFLKLGRNPYWRIVINVCICICLSVNLVSANAVNFLISDFKYFYFDNNKKVIIVVFIDV